LKPKAVDIQQQIYFSCFAYTAVVGEIRPKLSFGIAMFGICTPEPPTASSFGPTNRAENPYISLLTVFEIAYGCIRTSHLCTSI
jgi:hypothetical protein